MSQRESLGNRLVAENHIIDKTAKETRRNEVQHAIQRERSQVRWLGRAAVVAWAIALLVIPAAAILGSLMQIAWVSEGDSGLTLLIPTALLAAFGSLAGVVATVGWIYRGRTASLMAIEARLDELEAEIRKGELDTDVRER